MEAVIHCLDLERHDGVVDDTRRCRVICLNGGLLLGPPLFLQSIADGDQCLGAVINRAPSSASEAEVMTNLMIWAIARTAPFHFGIGASSERKIWAPSRLRPLLSLWKPASECAATNMSLERYSIPSFGYVAQ